ncbi:unnamed protein product [Ilex paraguariensis]|uniref:DUF3741 domain-containing protein n=1 Tax=Ilex paraguariensis TaxID=185542 RepID=A0ABC8QMU0_9AQUA
MTNSETSCKCFSGAIRRLLCTSSLPIPTHPSDHFNVSNTTDSNLHKEKPLPTTEPLVQAPATIGIVARLMGLDPLPDFTSVPKPRTLESMLRSRSVNYVDYLPQFDLSQAQHRRVRTSVSFREVPVFIDAQDHEFFVLYSSRRGVETIKGGLNVRKADVGNQELRQKKVEGSMKKKKKNMRESVCVNKENQENNKKSYKRKEDPKRVSGESPSRVGNGVPQKKNLPRKPRETLEAKSPVKRINPKEVSVGSKFTTKKKTTRFGAKKVEPEPSCISENSSTVSVPDSPKNLEGPMTEEDSGLMGLNPKKKSSPKITNYDYPCPNLLRKSSHTEDHHQEHRVISGEADKPVKSQESDYYTKLLRQMCILTEEDLKESNWVAGEVSKFEDIEEICLHFGQQILEQLLTQVVHELVMLH